MKETFPYIIILYVPANCTGIFQPCDVGIQQILKHSLKHSYHRDIVHDVTNQLEKGAEVTIEKRIGTLRNRSVAWLVQAYEDVNKVELVKKVSWRA